MCSQSTTGAGRGRLVIVSGYGNNALTPRGQRTRWLTEALAKEWEVELIAMPDKPSSARPGGSTSRRAAVRGFARSLVYRVLLDRSEPWSLRRLARWRPEVDAALLIASPWSPAIYASRRLAGAGIPYVVDVGDPWVLTADFKVTTAPLWRARRGERFFWEHAAGAVVTTRAQSEMVRAMFPDLPVMVRPNGYKPVEPTAPPPRPAGADSETLRIAHFGILSAGRVDPVPFLAELQRSGLWKSIVFSQFGDDFGVGLDRVPEGVRVEHHEPEPWDRVIRRAPEFDAALVVAYPLPALLPSKAIEYSTLPLPRIALTNPGPEDALREFAREHSGWLALSNGEDELPRRVREHVERAFSPAELAAPAEDAWPVVSERIADFVTERVDSVAAAR